MSELETAGIETQYDFTELFQKPGTLTQYELLDEMYSAAMLAKMTLDTARGEHGDESDRARAARRLKKLTELCVQWVNRTIPAPEGERYAQPD